MPLTKKLKVKTLIFCLFLIGITCQSVNAEFLPKGFLSATGFELSDSINYDPTYCDTGIKEKAEANYQSIKSIKPATGSTSIYHRFTVIKESYHKESEAVQRIFAVANQVPPNDEYQKSCMLRDAVRQHKNVYILVTDLALSYADKLPTLLELLRKELQAIEDSFPPEAHTVDQLAKLPDEDERRTRIGMAPLDVSFMHKACKKISQSFIDQKFNQNLLPEDYFFISWQADLNLDGLCEVLIRSRLPKYKTQQQILLTQLTQSSNINTNAEVKAEMIDAESKTTSLKQIGVLTGHSVSQRYATKGGYMRLEMRQYLDDNTLLYNFYGYDNDKKYYRLKWSDRYHLVEDGRYFKFEKRIDAK